MTYHDPTVAYRLPTDDKPAERLSAGASIELMMRSANALTDPEPEVEDQVSK